MGGEPVDLGGPRQRAVLARLAVAGGQVVSTDRLVDDLWRAEAPARALGRVVVVDRGAQIVEVPADGGARVGSRVRTQRLLKIPVIM